jgi:hypothetical protein
MFFQSSVKDNVNSFLHAIGYTRPLIQNRPLYLKELYFCGMDPARFFMYQGRILMDLSVVNYRVECLLVTPRYPSDSVQLLFTRLALLFVKPSLICSQAYLAIGGCSGIVIQQSFFLHTASHKCLMGNF